MPEILGKQIGPIAFGMMSLTVPGYTLSKQDASPDATLSAALATNSTFWNAAPFYGTPSHNSLHVLRSYLTAHPEISPKILLSVKACYDPATNRGIGAPADVKRELDAVLAALEGVAKVDVFECARVDPDVEVETTLRYIQEAYVEKGLVGGIALSEVSAETIRRAARVVQIVAVENELSLWTRDALSNGVAEVCGELGIPLVAYSPLGKGMLSGAIKSLDDLPANDVRRHYPRFQPDTFAANIKLVDEVRALAQKKGCTPAQFAINWVRCLTKRPGMPLIIPLPGSSNAGRVRENATLVEFSEEELREVDEVVAKVQVVGGRYPAGIPVDG